MSPTTAALTRIQRVRIQRLDAAGYPTGPALELAPASPTTNTKEHTAMTTNNPDAPLRPTKGAMDALQQQLRAALAAAEQRAMDARTEADRRKAAEQALADLDPEARALAGCTAALNDALFSRSTTSNYGTYVGLVGTQPSAFELPVGRVLLHLAQRFGVPIGPVVEQPPSSPVLDAVAQALTERGLA